MKEVESLIEESKKAIADDESSENSDGTDSENDS